LIQFVLEKMTGRDLYQLANEKIFEPLGMEQSSFLWERRFDGNVALEMGQLAPLVFKTRESSNGAASVLTNSHDYGKRVRELRRGFHRARNRRRHSKRDDDDECVHAQPHEGSYR